MSVCQKFTILLISFLCFINCQQNSPKLTIASAASVQFAAEKMAEAFTAETGITCRVVVGSSGKHTAQIKAGAPYDIFLSADLKYPEELHKSGVTYDQPKIYAYGHLIIWSAVEGIEPAIEQLNSERIARIALPNPKMAPYGIAALEVLRHYNLLDSVAEKLVYGESIMQSNQFIASGAAEVGFTSFSTTFSPIVRTKGKWTMIDSRSYNRIAQSMVIIKNNRQMYEQAFKFYNFILSDKGEEILNSFGYSR